MSKKEIKNQTRDYNQYLAEMRGSTRAQEQVLAESAAAEARLQGGLQARQAESFGSQARTMLGVYDQLLPQSLASQQTAAYGTLGMYGALAGQGTQAYMGSLPDYARNLSSLMGRQAYDELSLGYSLSPQQMTMAQQSARSAAAARGIAGNQAIGLEVLNNYKYGQDRYNQRLMNAQNAYTMGANQQVQAYNQFLTPAFNNAAPYGMANLLTAAQTGYQSLGPQFLQPESQYYANIRANRMQAQSAAYAAQQAKKGAIIGGALQAVGKIASSFAGADGGCWVARCVYGENNPRWLVFREWVTTEAPKWFRKLYISKGEAFAEYISDKPLLKAIIRKAMDIVVDKKLKEAVVA